MAVKNELMLQLEVLQLLMLDLKGLLVRKRTLDIPNAHMVFVLVEIVVVLHYVAFEFLLGHLLVQKELHMLLL